MKSASDLILANANVITLDPFRPRAQFVAIHGNKIQSVEDGVDLKRVRYEKAEVIDCQGRTVLPGFIDTHFHLHGFAESLVILNLEPRNKIASISDIQARIQELSKKLSPGTWIRGRGYNDFYLAEKRHPTRWDLDAATSTHPVRLTHRSGRAYVLNSLGLHLAGISKETGDPPGALIDREVGTGEPTGLLYGMGEYLGKVIPLMDQDQMEHGMRLADRELCSLGITSIHDCSPRNNLKRWEMFQSWKESGFLKSRITMMLGMGSFKEYGRQDFSAPVGEDQLRLGGVKIILHETTGRLTPSQEELNETVLQIHRGGLQTVIHAIEEKTTEAACSAIEYALQKLPRPDPRHRIEHCSVCDSSLARRLASLGITVITQPSFIYYNGDRYLRTVPSRQLNHLYAIATLMKNGVKVAASSDCPIAPANPLIGIYSATTRRTERGENILPEEAVSPLEAIRMYTENAAKSSFEEAAKGSITPGKLADLVVLSGDPTRLPAEDIKELKVEMTILNGEVVWNKMA